VFSETLESLVLSYQRPLKSFLRFTLLRVQCFKCRVTKEALFSVMVLFLLTLTFMRDTGIRNFREAELRVSEDTNDSFVCLKIRITPDTRARVIQRCMYFDS
jgi:hypothetical protein